MYRYTQTCLNEPQLHLPTPPVYPLFPCAITNPLPVLPLVVVRRPVVRLSLHQALLPSALPLPSGFPVPSALPLPPVLSLRVSGRGDRGVRRAAAAAAMAATVRPRQNRTRRQTATARATGSATRAARAVRARMRGGAPPSRGWRWTPRRSGWRRSVRAARRTCSSSRRCVPRERARRKVREGSRVSRACEGSVERVGGCRKLPRTTGLWVRGVSRVSSAAQLSRTRADGV